MINTISIENFQSHKNTYLEFPPGVSIITGSSDSGKSSIIRALLWSINNRPLGNQFKSWFSNEKESVEVGIEFDNGYLIKERKNSKNIYDINGTKFEAVKSDIPDDMQNLTNLSDYNIQTQIQPYFLLQDTAGEVAKRFNELIGLDVIDILFKNLNSSISNLKGKIADYNNEINNLNLQIKSLNFLDDIEVILNNLDLEEGEKEKVERKCLSVSETIQSIEELDSKILEIEIDSNLPNQINEILELYDFYMNKRMEYNVISSVLHNIKETEENLTAEMEWLSIESEYDEIHALQP